jgi:hypothetical protein
MGRFKRSKSRTRLRPLPLDVALLPEPFQKIVPVVNDVLFKLCKENHLKSYKIVGLLLNKKVFSFEVKFLFWENGLSYFNVFLPSKNIDECAIQQTKYGLSFNLLLGENVGEKTLYDKCLDWIKIVQGGVLLEDDVVKDLNSYYKKSGLPFSVRRSTEHEDRVEKLDIIVSGFHTEPFGVQLKTCAEDWVRHRRIHPKVPSVLLGHEIEVKRLAGSIKQIAQSLSEGKYEHINLKLKPPP